MILQPIDYLVYAWLIIALGCTAYVAIDQFRGNPEAAVMKWGFVLVTLYMGPIGLLLYVMSDKEPSPGTHERFVAPGAQLLAMREPVHGDRPSGSTNRYGLLLA